MGDRHIETTAAAAPPDAAGALEQPASFPKTIAGRYRVVKPLGRGGMGAVYVVEHINTGERFALKVMLAGTDDPDLLERFRREARASAQIATEHVVRVIDADTAPELDGQPFLVMELLDGSDLAHLVEERGPLPASEVLEYLTQAAIAIDRAHTAGIVHRDLKPENIFVHRTADGKRMVKVLDFGVARLMNPESTVVTKPGAIVGTPFYMAPEQARGHGDAVGPRTDVWAIGMIVLELLVGEGYWRLEPGGAAKSTAALLVAIIKASHDPPPSVRWPGRVTKELEAWFLRSCARDPNDRFGSVREQIDALNAVLGGAVTRNERNARNEPNEQPNTPRAAAPSGAPTLADPAAPPALPNTLPFNPTVLAAPPPPQAMFRPPLEAAVAAAPGTRETNKASRVLSFVGLGVLGAVILLAGLFFILKPRQAKRDSRKVEAASPSSLVIDSPEDTDDKSAPRAGATRAVTPRSSATSTASQPPAQPSTDPTAVGWVSVVCFPICDQVSFDDGKSIGRSPLKHELKVGHHVVHVHEESTGRTLHRPVIIVAGTVTPVRFDVRGSPRGAD